MSFSRNILSLQVNSNGVLSFRRPFTATETTPFPLSSDDILIAPFWDNIDIEAAGQVLFRITNDLSLRTEIGGVINGLFVTNFLPDSVFVATWDQVAQFNGTPSEVMKKNTAVLTFEHMH